MYPLGYANALSHHSPERRSTRYNLATNHRYLDSGGAKRTSPLRPLGQIDSVMACICSEGRMPNELLIRDVPSHVKSWIESECAAPNVTQKEFVISDLESACDGGNEPTLFDAIAL
jgi:hypothetical protein